SSDVAAEFSKRGRLQKLLHARHDFIKTGKNDSHAFFLYPLGVVTLLRHSPGVAFQNDRQAAHHGFGNTARAGLANHKIRSAHQAMHFLRETKNMKRETPGARTEFFGELVVAATDDDELDGNARGVQPLHDVIHHFGTESAEEENACGQIGLQAKLTAKSDRIRVIGKVEIG